MQRWYGLSDPSFSLLTVFQSSFEWLFYIRKSLSWQFHHVNLINIKIWDCVWVVIKLCWIKYCILDDLPLNQAYRFSSIKHGEDPVSLCVIKTHAGPRRKYLRSRLLSVHPKRECYQKDKQGAFVPCSSQRLTLTMVCLINTRYVKLHSLLVLFSATQGKQNKL